MRRVVLADLHVGQRPGDLDRLREEITSLSAHRPDEVVFLGDLFRTLVGFPRFWDDTVQSGLAALAALRRAGARVVLVEGNRDFFLDSPALSAYFDGVGQAHSFEAGGKRFLLEHGDLVNARDRSYLLWRAVSKSALARVWARLLPASLAQRIVHSTEARLARKNFSYRHMLPVGDMTAAARRHFAAGVDVVLWGHFHRGWRFAEAGREALVLPAWLEFGTRVWIDQRGDLVFENPPDNRYLVDSAGSS